MGKRKKQYDSFPRKKIEEQENSATIMTSIYGKGTVFPVKLKLQGESFEKTLKQENFKKRSNEFNRGKSPD